MPNKGKEFFNVLEHGDSKYVIYGASSSGGNANKGWVPYKLRLLQVPSEMPLDSDFRISKRGVDVLRDETVNMFSSFGPRSNPEKLMKEMRQAIREEVAGDDPKAGNAIDMIFAIQRGDLAKAEALLPVSDAKFANSQALREAVITDGAEGLAMKLIPVSDVGAKGSEALHRAVRVDEIGELTQALMPGSNLADWDEKKWAGISNEDRYRLYAMEAECNREKLQASTPTPQAREYLDPPSLCKNVDPSKAGLDQSIRSSKPRL